MNVRKQFAKYVSQNIFGMTGVWLAYPAAEALTLIVTLMGMRKVLRVGNE